MPFVTCGGVRVAYALAGQGPGLVLVHGTGGSGKATWAHLRGRLTDRWTVLTPDLEGSGDTTYADRALHLDNRPLRLDDLVEHVTAAADDANAAPFDLVGYSLGAVVAARLAANRGELVHSLVLVAGWAAADSRMQLQFRLWRDLFARDRESLSRLLVHTGLSPPHLSALSEETIEAVVGDLVATMPAGFGRQSELATNIDVSEDLHRIRTPTLVIGLIHDQIVPVEHAEALHRAIRNSSYTELVSGHAVMFERPDDFVVTLRSFFGTAT